jgi:hypothetical protein
VIALARVVAFRGTIDRRLWTISAIQLQLEAAPVVTLLIGATLVTTLLAYIVAEQFGTMIQK